MEGIAFLYLSFMLLYKRKIKMDLGRAKSFHVFFFFHGK